MGTAASPAAQEARRMCFVCRKPSATCVCATITPVDNKTFIHVIQHPREQSHPIGTARFVELGLRRSECILAATPQRDLRVPPIEGAALLYPSADARPLVSLDSLDSLDSLWRPSPGLSSRGVCTPLPSSMGPSPGIIVLDGTWPQARALYRANAWLHTLPHVSLRPSAPSRYRIRREPREDFVSTLESVVLALRLLEPSTQGLDALLAAFDSMIDTQLGYIERSGGRHRRRKLRRHRSFVGVPQWFAENFDNLVAVYADAPRPDPSAACGPLLQLTAHRFSDGALFDRVVAREEAITPAELTELGLTESALAAAKPLQDIVSEFTRFVGEGQCMAWNDSSPTHMRAAGLPFALPGRAGPGEASVQLLRPIVRSFEARRGAPNTRSVAEPDPSLSPLGVRGRAGLRLANLTRIAHALLARARQSRS